jgi:hypothetical protein
MVLLDDYQILNQKDIKPSHFVYDQLGFKHYRGLESTSYFYTRFHF